MAAVQSGSVKLGDNTFSIPTSAIESIIVFSKELHIDEVEAARYFLLSADISLSSIEHKQFATKKILSRSGNPQPTPVAVASIAPPQPAPTATTGAFSFSTPAPAPVVAPPAIVAPQSIETSAIPLTKDHNNLLAYA